MTTDAFTTAARDHAELRCTINPSTRMGAKLWSTHQMHDFGVAMAEWARDHIARQEPTDAEITAMARLLNYRGIWACIDCGIPGSYAEGCEECVRLCDDLARAALTTAKEARS